MAKRNKRNEFVFLDDILESIEKIEEYIEGWTEQEFERNSEKQDSVIRRIQILGEAVKNISPETRNQYSDIPWRDIAGMRDIVIHHYFGVSISMVWRVATSELPDLKMKIQEIVREMDRQ